MQIGDIVRFRNQRSATRYVITGWHEAAQQWNVRKEDDDTHLGVAYPESQLEAYTQE